MVFTCLFCEKETVYVSRFCPKCRALKHLLLIYNDRLYEIVNSVLCRDIEKQENKIKAEIKKDIDHRTRKLRSTKSVGKIE